mmetsp:Transcript_6552/g.16067  ORF Transcript_6552/g.16067 Transcript_6552/m.16067 type:complete len:82 (-) Transcript_6552:1381-1626(-)
MRIKVDKSLVVHIGGSASGKSCKPSTRQLDGASVAAREAEGSHRSDTSWKLSCRQHRTAVGNNYVPWWHPPRYRAKDDCSR